MTDVNIVEVEKDLKPAIKDAVEGIGGFSKFIKKGDKVLLKPNLNTADLFPASSDTKFLEEVIGLVHEHDTKEVIVGDACTFMQNTRKVMEKLDVFKFEKMFPNTKVISFDEEKWERKDIPKGKYMRCVHLPEILNHIDKLIMLPCLKTHYIAKFTGSLKLSVGFMKKSDKMKMHMGKVQEKIADLIICGEAAIDTYAGSVGPMLAEQLAIPAVTYVTKVTAESDKLMVERDIGDKTLTIETGFPVLLTATKELNEPRLPNMMQILGAANKKIETWGASDLALAPDQISANMIEHPGPVTFILYMDKYLIIKFDRPRIIFMDILISFCVL